MEKSKNFGFNLPSRDTDDVVDINQISDNFRIIDENVPNKGDVGGTVDQHYDPKSKNAQSGKAVAEAIGDIEDAVNAVIVLQESFFADTTDLITAYPIILDSSTLPDGVKCNLMSDGALVIDIDGQKVKDAYDLPIAFVSLPKGNYRFVCLTSIIIDDDYAESNEWSHNLKICNPATTAEFSFIELEKKTTMGKYRYASFGSSTQFPCMLYYSYHSDDTTSENVPNNITIELRPKIYRI